MWDSRAHDPRRADRHSEGDFRGNKTGVPNHPCIVLGMILYWLMEKYLNSCDQRREVAVKTGS